MPEKWSYNNKKLEFEVNMKIQYDKILEYKYWRQNKAVFYHELLHMQLQLENWNNLRWWDDYCKKIIEWVKTKQGAPPDIVQDAGKIHEHCWRGSMLIPMAGIRIFLR